MARDPQREYHIARAVWLYQRLLLATSPIKRAAITRRIVSWLDRCPTADRAEYYRRVTAIYEAMARPNRAEQRAALSRAAGAEILQSLTDDEKRTTVGCLLPYEDHAVEDEEYPDAD